MDVSVFRFDTAMFQPCGRTRITAAWRRHSASALSAGAASCRLPQLKMPPYSLAVDSIAPAACGRFRAVRPPSNFLRLFSRSPTPRSTCLTPPAAVSSIRSPPYPSCRPCWAASRNWSRNRSEPSSSPRWTSSLGTDLTFSFSPFVLGCFSLIFSISITSCLARPKPCRAPAPSGHAAAIVSDGRVVIS